MKNKKVRNLVFIFCVLIAHTFVLSFWLTKEVKKTSLNVAKTDNLNTIKSDISSFLIFNIDSEIYVKPSISRIK
jgi:hypothetical protein